MIRCIDCRTLVENYIHGRCLSCHELDQENNGESDEAPSSTRESDQQPPDTFAELGGSGALVTCRACQQGRPESVMLASGICLRCDFTAREDDDGESYEGSTHERH